MESTHTPFRRQIGAMSTALLIALAGRVSAGEDTQRGDATRDDRIEKLERVNRALLEKVEAISRDYQSIAVQNAELVRRLDELSRRVSVAPAPGPAPRSGHLRVN